MQLYKDLFGDGEGGVRILFHLTLPNTQHTCHASFVDPGQGSSFTKMGCLVFLKGSRTEVGPLAGERLPRVYAVKRSYDGVEQVSLGSNGAHGTLSGRDSTQIPLALFLCLANTFLVVTLLALYRLFRRPLCFKRPRDSFTWVLVTSVLVWLFVAATFPLSSQLSSTNKGLIFIFFVFGRFNSFPLILI